MITINEDDSIPDKATCIIRKNNVVEVYFDDDDFVIKSKVQKFKLERQVSINCSYNEAEKRLSVNKNQYKDLRDAVLVGSGHKQKTPVETKQAFKDAVAARTALQNKRDDLLEAIDSATTIEELELIKW